MQPFLYVVLSVSAIQILGMAIGYVMIFMRSDDSMFDDLYDDDGRKPSSSFKRQFSSPSFFRRKSPEQVRPTNDAIQVSAGQPYPPPQALEQPQENSTLPDPAAVEPVEDDVESTNDDFLPSAPPEMRPSRQPRRDDMIIVREALGIYNFDSLYLVVDVKVQLRLLDNDWRRRDRDLGDSASRGLRSRLGAAVLGPADGLDLELRLVARVLRTVRHALLVPHLKVAVARGPGGWESGGLSNLSHVSLVSLSSRLLAGPRLLGLTAQRPQLPR